MKRLVAMLCIVGITMAIFMGCAPQNSGSKPASSVGGSSESSATGEPVTLRMSWWGSQMRHDQTVAVLKKYMELNKNVKVEYEFNGFSGYWDKIATQAAGGNLPDVWQNSVNYVLSYVEKNQLLDLTPYTENGVIDVSDWEDSTLSTGKINGKLFALGMGMSSHCIAYNPELFAQAGVAEPTIDWTWEDYTAAAKQIKEKTGVYGDSDFPGSSLEGFDFYLRQNGQSLFNETKDALAYTDDNLFIEYNQMALDLKKSGALMPIDQSLETGDALEQSPIVTGKSAMLGACSSNQLAALVTASGKKLSLTTLPHKKGESQPGNYVTPSMYICASSKNANAEESAKLINFILNDAAANEIFLGERGVPGSSRMRELIASKVDENGKAVIKYVDDIMKIAPKCDPLRPAAISEMNDLYIRLEQQILFEQITPADAAKQFRTEATAMLKK